jgi:8-oxo-dGTP diphosphatase
MGEKIGVRPCAIIIKDKKVLCIEAKYGDDEFYLFPGGGIEAEETMRECVIRETYEETGLNIKVKDVVYINDWIKDKKKNLRVINSFFLAEIVDGIEEIKTDDGGKVKSLQWIDIKKLKNIDLRPKFIAENLHDDYLNNFKNNKIYFE